MVRHPVHPHAFAALGVAAVLAALAFLLERALSTEFHPDARALTLLRELADFDSRRNAEAGRLAGDLSLSPGIHADDRATPARLARRELDRASGETTVASRMPALREALDAKDEAYRRFRTSHAETRVALQALEGPLAALERLARPGHARNADAAIALTSLVDGVRQDLHDPDIERAPQVSSRLAERAPLIVAAAVTLDAGAAETGRRARDAVDTFVVARRAEAQAWHELAVASAGEQLHLAARTLERRIDSALDERERWRVYLVAYACALAVGLSYLFFRQSSAIAKARRSGDAMNARLAEQGQALAHAHSEQQAMQSQLIAMGRYGAIGQLTAGISHEIARPLAVARTHLSAVRSTLPDLRGAQDEAQRLVDLLRSSDVDARQVDKAVSALASHLQHLRRHNAVDGIDALAWGGLRDLEHIADLMAQLRTFFRADSAASSSFNVNDAAHAALLIAGPLLQGLVVEKSLGDVPAIDCRPGEVIQLTLTLIARAAQAAHRPGGRVRVATRALSDGVALDIWNDGAVHKEDGDLTIARHIVARHAGGIAVRPSGEGMLVAVELPLAAPRAAANG
jgi:signal transduction histidine kinase